MLRAVLSEVEVVLSPSALLRGSLEVCGHLFELGCGSSAAAVRTVAFPRPEVDREGSSGVGAAVFLRRLTQPVVLPGQARAGRGCSSTSFEARACRDPGPKRKLPASGPVAKAAKEAAQPRGRGATRKVEGSRASVGDRA